MKMDIFRASRRGQYQALFDAILSNGAQPLTHLFGRLFGIAQIAFKIEAHVAVIVFVLFERPLQLVFHQLRWEFKRDRIGHGRFQDSPTVVGLSLVTAFLQQITA